MSSLIHGVARDVGSVVLDDSNPPAACIALYQPFDSETRLDSANSGKPCLVVLSGVAVMVKIRREGWLPII